MGKENIVRGNQLSQPEQHRRYPALNRLKEDMTSSIKMCITKSLLAACTITAFACIAAPNAYAYDLFNYFNSPLAPNTWSYGYVGQFNNNWVRYLGAGTVAVCERGHDPANDVVISLRCGNNSVTGQQDYGPRDNQSLKSRLHAQNASPWNHTIRGDGVYGTPSPATATAPLSQLKDDFAVLRKGGEPQASGELAYTSGRAFVTIGSNSMCLNTTEFGKMSCVGFTHAERGDLRAAVVCSPALPPATVAIYGVVPDTVKQIDLIGDRGIIRSLDVHNSLYGIKLPAAEASEIVDIVPVGAPNDDRQTGRDIVPADTSCA
ncbi:hypothetical protein [Pseudonocardia sp. DLS-67]